jgi:signal transduction histidine kinase
LDGGKILVWIDPPPGPIQERRTEFLGIASHDLRGSIANSRSYASLLLSPRMELGEKARHCAEVIQRNADRALRLLGECFDLFLHEQQALDLDRTPEDLTAVLGEAVDRARALATLRGVRLVAQVPPQLPATSVDRGRLVQAVLAFAAHSIARAGKGQPVRFEVRKQNDSIRVEVSDEEESASPRDAGLFYDAEARAIAEGRLGEGFRLGLARATIEAHGGEVGARSSLATGSTFYFTLPLS